MNRTLSGTMPTIDVGPVPVSPLAMPPNVALTPATTVEGYLVPLGSFGWAIESAKSGRRVRRAGWNGKGMFIFHACPRLEEESAHLGVPPLGELLDMPRRPCLCMRDAQGSIVFGWLASQTDMLSTDWEMAD